MTREAEASTATRPGSSGLPFAFSGIYSGQCHAAERGKEGQNTNRVPAAAS